MEFKETDLKGVYIIEPRVFADARLHYQKGDLSQAKLVRVISGRVVDVAVDIRRSSPTFGRHIMVELSGDNKRQLFIPRGFAHGFAVLSPEAVFTYKVDNPYAPQQEAGIRWDDPELAIQWPIDPKEYVDDLAEPNPRQLVKLKNRYMAEIKKLVEGEAPAEEEMN